MTLQRFQTTQTHRQIGRFLTSRNWRCKDFLQLLTSQITNQDPLEPMKDTEFISQMANIASLEQMQQFTDGFSNFAQSHNSMLAHSFLGKLVSIDDKGEKLLVWLNLLKQTKMVRICYLLMENNILLIRLLKSA